MDRQLLKAGKYREGEWNSTHFGIFNTDVVRCPDCRNQLSVVIYGRMTYRSRQGTVLKWLDLLNKSERAFTDDGSHDWQKDGRRKIVGFVNLPQRNKTKSLSRIVLTSIRVEMVNTAAQDRSGSRRATVFLGCRICPERR